MTNSIERLEAVAKLLTGLKSAYPDAKEFHVDIDFQWRTSYDNEELVPVVKIDIKRGFHDPQGL